MKTPPAKIYAPDFTGAYHPDLALRLRDRLFRAHEGTDSASMTHLGEKHWGPGKCHQRIELARPGAQTAAGASLVVDGRHEGVHRLDRVEGWFEIERAVGLLDIAVKEPDRSLASKSHR
jgi:hypothetical protein